MTSGGLITNRLPTRCLPSRAPSSVVVTPKASGLMPIDDYLNLERLRRHSHCVMKVGGHALTHTHTLVELVVEDALQFKWGRRLRCGSGECRPRAFEDRGLSSSAAGLGSEERAGLGGLSIMVQARVN